MEAMLEGTFTQKLLLMIFVGFFAACGLWGFRHIIQEAFYETSNAGWRDSLRGSTGESRHR